MAQGKDASLSCQLGVVPKALFNKTMFAICYGGAEVRSVVRLGFVGVVVFLLGSSALSFAQTTTTALFPEVVVGGGFSTNFTLVNTGSSALAGNLVLTLQGTAHVNVSDLVLNKTSNFSGSSITIPISGIPSGGSMFLSAASTDSAAAGWGQVQSAGGTLGAVATFSLTSAAQLQTIAGVLSSDLVSAATIPVDDSFGQQRYTGFAVANPGSSQITIKVLEVGADGNLATAATLTPVTLNPGQQTASFLFQDPNAIDHNGTNFKGSAVLIGENGATFSVVALVQVQGTTGVLYTAIPVLPSKAPNIN